MGLSVDDSSLAPPVIDVAKANGMYQQQQNSQDSSTSNGSSSLSLPSPDLPSRVKSLECELRDVTSELAGSIRREMELEDMVDRLQMGMSSPSNDYPHGTSDYFSSSDSGVGSDVVDPDRVKRSAEQERAHLKAEFSQRWQDEREHHAALESHVQFLRDQVEQVCCLFFQRKVW